MGVNKNSLPFKKGKCLVSENSVVVRMRLHMDDVGGIIYLPWLKFIFLFLSNSLVIVRHR